VNTKGGVIMSDTTVHISEQGLPERSPGKRTKHVGLLGPDAIALYVNNIDTPLIVQVAGEVSLGRITPNNPFQPHVDLMPYGAYDQGVSRVHATIRRTAGNHWTVTDLMSNNGTTLNGVKLVPHTPQQIIPGDRIRLGQMLVEVYPGSTGESSAEPHPMQMETKNLAPTVATKPIGTGQEPHGTLPQAEPGVQYHGEVVLDLKRIFSQMGQITEEVIQQLVNTPGIQVKLTLVIDAQGDLKDEIVHMLNEKTDSLKFTKSDVKRS
jgi:pSer/pThr/pTyr-binding forkhead associated (FHA) protein